MIDTISRILEEELSYVYCDNCKHNNTFDDECEDCHRKYQNWALSRESAVNIAEKIAKVLEDF